MWSEKYRPKKPDQLIGNEEARLALALWLSKWKPGAKAALLVGPPGTGKTTFVNLLAKDERDEPGRPQRERRPDEGQAQRKMGEAMQHGQPLRREVADLPRRGRRARREGRLRRRRVHQGIGEGEPEPHRDGGERPRLGRDQEARELVHGRAVQAAAAEGGGDVSQRGGARARASRWGRRSSGGT